MSEYERVERELRDILRMAANALALKTTPYGSKLSTAEEKSLNSLISQILSLDSIEVRADKQTIIIPCYEDGDETKCTHIEAKPPSWITDAGFIKVIPK